MSTELDDVKKAAEEYMKDQIHMFSLMTLLTPKDMEEFKHWFNAHPYNARLKGIPQPLA
jgi:hypothetical protein